jgi:hypothetical protein
MKYVLNKQKGTIVNHPSVGRLKGGIAYEITDKEAIMLKHIINLIVFEDIVFKDKEITKK